ncbi:hypothetical protein MXF26_04735 [Pantoea dispersa]|uniref:hypothetical protein n=1 Tax=Pantoea dispersa TaxID=59814 RepID=UPI002DBAE7DD|nr:hypothetical protein [Pantoea dispersa]MEB5835557.1 hypothetical protein [Pantoea dispersa]
MQVRCAFTGDEFASTIKRHTDDSNGSLTCPIKASPKRKASAPGMARPIGMDAGFFAIGLALMGPGTQLTATPPNIHESGHKKRCASLRTS